MFLVFSVIIFIKYSVLEKVPTLDLILMLLEVNSNDLKDTFFLIHFTVHSLSVFKKHICF